MQNITLNLLTHQAEFIKDTTTRNLALVGGYGAGKTQALATKLIILSLLNPGHEGIALSPTYGMSQKVLIPMIESILRDNGIPHSYSKSNFHFVIGSGLQATKLHIMAAETYERAAGINAAFFGVDECDLINEDVALAAWRLLSSRLRKGKVYQGCAVSTPEGFKFLYKFFEEEPLTDPSLAASRRIIRASTYDNPFLPKEYIQELETQYPPHLIKAYLHGQFVNLSGKTVYYAYSKENNHSNLSLDNIDPYEQLHLGIDFNYAGMSVTTAIIRYDEHNQPEIHLVDEIIGSKNTHECIKAIQYRYKNRNIIAYPDPAGNQRKSSAQDTDIAQLRQAGIPMQLMNIHPLIKDRVASVNALFDNGQNQHRLKINPRTCPYLTKAIASQTYDIAGNPKKNVLLGINETYIDGPLDALGYFVYTKFPLHTATSRTLKITGV